MHGNESNRVNGTILYVIQTFICAVAAVAVASLSPSLFLRLSIFVCLFFLHKCLACFAFSLHQLVIVMPVCFIRYDHRWVILVFKIHECMPDTRKLKTREGKVMYMCVQYDGGSNNNSKGNNRNDEVFFCLLVCRPKEMFVVILFSLNKIFIVCHWLLLLIIIIIKQWRLSEMCNWNEQANERTPTKRHLLWLGKARFGMPQFRIPSPQT